ncbi:MAG TPA: TonB-dependent receptor [Niabella sp.]|nr:TonB-dependent receptor family protein [Chitinophagaceae bacterium]HRO83826.1 TonB-dependent receptor [Niabella sp.]
MQKYGIIILLLSISFLTNAQSVRGVLTDPIENTIINSATVQLQNAEDTTQKRSSLSDSKGAFIFRGLTKGNYILKATSIGFETLIRTVSITDSVPNVNLGVVYIPKKTVTLEGVVIVASPPNVVQRGDTTQFGASQFKVNPDATVEDLIKKMPGVTVDRSGTVTAQGEQVKKVTVDGKDFFGDDATAALRNLPSDVVDKIQLFDRMSEQAQLTGFDDGNSVKAINIVTKSGIKNGQFGRVYAGYGTDNHYAGGGNMSFFNGDRRLSFVGNFNNINQQNFASQDLLGVTSSGGGRGGFGGGGGGRGGGGGFGGFGGGNFMVGQSPGISQTNAFGINYGDKWGKKMTVTGSYFFNNSNIDNNSFNNRVTTFSPDSILVNYDQSKSNSTNFNNRVNMRMEYKIDSNNTIIFIPNLNFQSNKSNSDYSSYAFLQPNDSTNSSSGTNESKRNGFNLSNMLMYRHSFAKRGRSFYVSLNTNHSKNDGYSIADEFTRNFYPSFVRDSIQNQKTINNTKGSNYSGRVGYTEPIGKNSMLEFNYSGSIQRNNADQKAYSFDGNDYTIFNTQLSNLFDSKVITNGAGINYRIGQSRDNQLAFGLDYQNSNLQSDRLLPNPAQVDQSFNSLLPNMRWMRKIGQFSNIRLFYRASTSFPSVTQLQDVPNTVTLLRPSVGNPNLKQSYSNFISGRYSYTNTRNNNSFFVNIFARTTNNYISNATYLARKDSTIEQGVVISRNAQLSKPVNLNGYSNISSFLTYSMPLKPIKSNLNVNVGASYSRLPGMINYLKTFTKNYSYSGGVGLSSNISEYIDYNIAYNANFSNAISSANNANNRYINQTLSLQLNLLSKNGWFLQNDVFNQSYNGLSAGYNQNYWLWNAAVGKKFLKQKKGELKLTVFDLLKQNQSISRTIADNYIEDSQNLVLKQYFMLTFTYSLKNFGKGRASSGGDNERRDWRGGPPPGGMMGMPPPGGSGPMF